MRHEWDTWYSGTQAKCWACGAVRQSLDARGQYTAHRLAARYEYRVGGRKARIEPECITQTQEREAAP